MPIAHITLATRDVPATASFFREVLGWEPVPRPGNIGREAAWLSMGPGQELHLVHVEDFLASPFEKEFGRHIAIEVPLREFNALQERLQAHGAEVIPPERPTPFQRFFFREPNGYVFEVVDADRQPEA